MYPKKENFQDFPLDLNRELGPFVSASRPSSAFGSRTATCVSTPAFRPRGQGTRRGSRSGPSASTSSSTTPSGSVEASPRSPWTASSGRVHCTSSRAVVPCARSSFAWARRSRLRGTTDRATWSRIAVSRAAETGRAARDRQDEERTAEPTTSAMDANPSRRSRAESPRWIRFAASGPS